MPRERGANHQLHQLGQTMKQELRHPKSSNLGYLEASQLGYP